MFKFVKHRLWLLVLADIAFVANEAGLYTAAFKSGIIVFALLFCNTFALAALILFVAQKLKGYVWLRVFNYVALLLFFTLMGYEFVMTSIGPD
jgi:hypothetical protein